MSYGLLIPPKWFRDTTPKQYSKQGLIVALYRAFLTVGMLPIRALNPPGLNIESQTSETDWADRLDTRWFLDYPTDETFTLGGVAYRPIVILGTINRRSTDSNPYYNTGNCAYLQFAVHHGYRRADRFLASDIQSFGSYLSPNLGFGARWDQGYWNEFGSSRRAVAFDYWKQSLASPNPYTTALLGVSNLHVVLGPSGLLVQVGTGKGKEDSNNLLNFIQAFGGTRIPGRGRIPEQDPLAGLTNPVVPITLGANGTAQYTAYAPRELVNNFGITRTQFSGYTLGGWILGASYDLKYTTSAVMTYMFNLENIERPVFPIGSAVTLGSPRAASPSASHILNRLIYVVWNRWGAQSDYYSPTDPTIRSEPTPAWADVWTCEGVRFADATAPAGEFTDPVSLKTWFIMKSAYVGQMAFETTGRVVYGAFSYTAASLLNDAHYSLASAGFASAFPTTTVWSAAGSAIWAADPGVDQMSCSYYAVDGDVRAVISVTGAMPQTYFTVSCDILNRASSGSAGDINRLYYQYSTDGGVTWETLITVPCAGADTGATYYNFTPSGDIAIPLSLDGKIYLRWYSTSYGDYHSRGTVTQRVRNIHVKRFG